jgi:hypothetical protein
MLLSEKEHLNSRARKLKEQGLTHSLKKATGQGKKRKKLEATTINVDSSVPNFTDTNAKVEAFVRKENNAVSIGGIKNAATASLTARVLADEQEKSKRRKFATSENLKSLFSSGKSTSKDGDFMTRGFSIPAGAKR